MTSVEYVDAGVAIDQGRLSGKLAGGDVANHRRRDVPACDLAAQP